jgi:hypothetical protein
MDSDIEEGKEYSGVEVTTETLSFHQQMVFVDKTLSDMVYCLDPNEVQGIILFTVDQRIYVVNCECSHRKNRGPDFQVERLVCRDNYTIAICGNSARMSESRESTRRSSLPICAIRVPWSELVSAPRISQLGHFPRFLLRASSDSTRAQIRRSAGNV